MKGAIKIFEQIFSNRVDNFCGEFDLVKKQ